MRTLAPEPIGPGWRLGLGAILTALAIGIIVGFGQPEAVAEPAAVAVPGDAATFPRANYVVLLPQTLPEPVVLALDQIIVDERLERPATYTGATFRSGQYLYQFEAVSTINQSQQRVWLTAFYEPRTKSVAWVVR